MSAELVKRIDAALESGFHCYSEVEHLLREAREELARDGANEGRKDSASGAVGATGADGGEEVSARWLLDQLKDRIRQALDD
jgi:hypothetical protein